MKKNEDAITVSNKLINSKGLKYICKKIQLNNNAVNKIGKIRLILLR